MKKNYKRLLPLLITLPALMANAPVPQVFNQEYKDFELTYVSHVQNGEKYDYTYHLKNTGEGYIDYVRLDYETKDAYYGLFYDAKYGSIFKDLVIEPGFDQDIVMSRTNEIPDIQKLKAECAAYALFDDSVTISGTKEVTLLNKYSDAFYYKIDLGLQYSDTNWNYGAVVKINYDENSYYVKVGVRGEYRIKTSEELDLSKLEVLDVTVIKSRPYLYGIADVALVIAIVVIVCLFILIGGGIFAAIFVPAMVRRKRRRRAAALAKKQQAK